MKRFCYASSLDTSPQWGIGNRKLAAPGTGVRRQCSYNRPMLLRLAVFLITFSGLTFEIALTRIYSATIWYHFTFVAVSVALLGWGLGGLAVHLQRRRAPLTLERA